MRSEPFGRITKITGSKVTILVQFSDAVNKVSINNFILNYVSIGSLIGTRLVDGRTLVLSIEEIYEHGMEQFISASISGIYDNVLRKFSFGTDAFPLIGESVSTLSNDVLACVFAPKKEHVKATVGTYIYDNTVFVGYNPDVLFGKHLGIYGNTGSGKTCTVVSIIQNYIRNNPWKDIKFIILDVNGEYRTAFEDDEYEYYEFNQIRLNHTILNGPEYQRLFRAADGIQYPALRECIKELACENPLWDMMKLEQTLEKWIDAKTPVNPQKHDKDFFTNTSIQGNLRPMLLRIESITSDYELMGVINNAGENTLERILRSDKKVHILDLQVSIDALDIVLYLLFKTIYQYKVEKRKQNIPNPTHLNLVLEEAHRYINADLTETKLGNYYIDKLSREGRKFGIGLVISSQVPSMLSQEIVSQCNSVIMHKITSKRDMEFLRNVLRISNDAFFLQMSALEKQHAIVCGEAFPNDSIVKIHDAYPLPMSNDPVIDDIPFLQSVPNNDDGIVEAPKPDPIKMGEDRVFSESSVPTKWDELIVKLQNSPNFATTKSLLRELSKNTCWTDHQVNELCEAAISNTQVSWIMEDGPVWEFYNRLLKNHIMTDGPAMQVFEMLDEAKH